MLMKAHNQGAGFVHYDIGAEEKCTRYDAAAFWNWVPSTWGERQSWVHVTLVNFKFKVFSQTILINTAVSTII